MQTAAWLQFSMMELVFLNRNKEYGAYDIRLRYRWHMTLGILISIAIFLSVIGLSYLMSKSTPETIATEVILSPQVLEKAPTLPKPHEVPVLMPHRQDPPIRSRIQFIAPSVVEDDSETIEANLPTNNDLSEKLIGSENIDGPENGIDPGLLGDSGSVNEPVESGEKNEMMPLYAVQQKPEFPGGEQAMYLFIRTQLKIPAHARELGHEINVLAEFVIDKDGSVSEVKIIRSTLSMMEKPSIDVIMSMPQWKPAKHNGIPVKVTFHLPIKVQFQ